MGYKIIVEERAKADIREAARWMAQYSPEKATLWHFDIEDAILSLENMPARCPRARESQFYKREIRHLIFGKYRILFTIDDETVRILHVRHSARDHWRPDDDE